MVHLARAFALLIYAEGSPNELIARKTRYVNIYLLEYIKNDNSLQIYHARYSQQDVVPLTYLAYYDTISYMSALLDQSSTQNFQEESSLLSQMTLHFEYNKTISQARDEIRVKRNKD